MSTGPPPAEQSDGTHDLAPLGAPSDPLRPMGRFDPEQASQEAKTQMAAKARKVPAGLAIAIGAAVLLVVALIVVIAASFD
ncbi:MAG TPA: hypothetical protein VM327_10305 [Candidatus Thermoplasmatota archaeon]|nr:hypothetical protein [Candidatus Thermoplasmatota archaeon]